jgi:LysM repeat protein
MKSSSTFLVLLLVVFSFNALAQKVYPVKKMDAIEALKDRLSRQKEVLLQLSPQDLQTQNLSTAYKTRPKWTSDVDCHALEYYQRGDCETEQENVSDCESQALDLSFDEAEWLSSNMLENWDESKVNIYNFDLSKFKEPVALTLYCEENQNHWSMPLNFTKINSKFGQRRRRWHHGLDLDLEIGDPIYAAFDGVVRISSYNRRGYGKYVVVRHKNGLETVYGHLSEQMVKPGDLIKAGDLIGLGGNTGRSTGPHLHFETRYQGQSINPELIYDFDNDEIRGREFTITSQLCEKKIIYSKKRSNKQSLQAKSKSKSTATKKNSSGSKPSTSASTRSKSKIHVVKSGDTLSGIASKHGTTVSKICMLNGLKSNSVLALGKQIKVQ